VRRVATTLLCLSAAGCALAPPAAVPVVAVPASYAEMSDWVTASPSDHVDTGPWWHVFDDPTLNTLETALTESNPSLKVALARFDEAQAAARVAAGGLWPRVSAGVGASRLQTSTQGPAYSPNRADIYSDFSAAASMSYEVDVFGRLRAAAASSRAQAQAAAGDERALRLALQAELAGEYFQLRALDSQSEVLEATVADDETALRITENLHQGGALAAGDVAQSRVQLESARTQAADVRLRRAQTEHALAVLLGRAPADWHCPSAPLPATVTVPTVEVGIPSTLLQRRPDIAAAERRVDSAAAGVGLARSTYFPVFQMGATLGRESVHSATWWSAPARFWSVTPSAVYTLLDGGQRRAQVAGATAALAEATETYRKTVLAAYQDVEDSLAAARELALEQASAKAAVDAASIARAQAQHRFDAGATTYLDVALAQNALLTAQLNALSITQRRLVATTQLIRAVGGDWR
jgi:outer membrane protein, multidrug efflux system